jgi:phosphoglycolate phosphatase
MSKAFRAVIYDLDGTLVDSRGDLADSVNAMLARLGLARHADALVWSFVGDGAERLIRRALGAANEHRFTEALPIWLEEYDARLLDKTRLYPGIAELLRLPPLQRAVLTNKPGGFARRIVEGLGVAPAFAQVIGGDEGPRKPDPANLLRICAAFSVSKEEVLLVGDSAVDLSTGRAAGVRVCAVSWGFGERASLASADFLCDTAAELNMVLQLRA